ncbi:hypothetical protein HGB48_28230, partial [Actinomadura latina]|nr:hypothetical protein [Actinomadura latina]
SRMRARAAARRAGRPQDDFPPGFRPGGRVPPAPPKPAEPAPLGEKAPGTGDEPP